MLNRTPKNVQLILYTRYSISRRADTSSCGLCLFTIPAGIYCCTFSPLSVIFHGSFDVSMFHEKLRLFQEWKQAIVLSLWHLQPNWNHAFCLQNQTKFFSFRRFQRFQAYCKEQYCCFLLLVYLYILLVIYLLRWWLFIAFFMISCDFCVHLRWERVIVAKTWILPEFMR